MASTSEADERGASAIEMVIIFPVTLFVVLAIVQVGIWYHAAAIARAAAQQAVKAASADGARPGDGVAGAQQVLADNAHGLLTTSTVIPIEGANDVRVTVRGRALSFVPLLDLPIEASAQAPLERSQVAGP